MNNAFPSNMNKCIHFATLLQSALEHSIPSPALSLRLVSLPSPLIGSCWSCVGGGRFDWWDGFSWGCKVAGCKGTGASVNGGWWNRCCWRHRIISAWIVGLFLKCRVSWPQCWFLFLFGSTLYCGRKSCARLAAKILLASSLKIRTWIQRLAIYW